MSTLSFPLCVEAGVAAFGNGIAIARWWLGTFQFELVTSDGEALLIDTMFDYARAMLEGFRHAGGAKDPHAVQYPPWPIRCYGNALVEGAEIVATESAKTAMRHETPEVSQGALKARGVGPDGEYFLHCFGRYEFGGIDQKLPDHTFHGQTTRQVGAKTVELIEVGPAHTGGDAIAYVPSDRAVFTGDILFIEGHPIVWAGPIGNWIAACQSIEAMEAEVIVPGHGPLTDKQGVARVREYLTYPRRSEEALRQRHGRAGSGARHLFRRFRQLGR